MKFLLMPEAAEGVRESVPPGADERDSRRISRESDLMALFLLASAISDRRRLTMGKDRSRVETMS